MYTSKTDPSRKFGSAFRGARFDDYHATPQPEMESTPKEEGSSDADVAKAHSPVTSFHFVHDHTGHKHSVTSTREDGTTEMVEHNSPKEAHDSAAKLAVEEGGVDQAVDTKKKMHPDQQGAPSEERNYEQPDLV
jgi:hypothetical protein